VLAVAETISQAADSDVLARASSEGRILVTNDKDFGELAFRVGQVHQGVLLLDLRRLGNSEAHGARRKAKPEEMTRAKTQRALSSEKTY